MSDQTSQATPHWILMEKLMSACGAKSELEWAAAREVQDLRERIAKLGGANKRLLRLAHENQEELRVKGNCIRDLEAEIVRLKNVVHKEMRAAYDRRSITLAAEEET